MIGLEAMHVFVYEHLGTRSISQHIDLNGYDILEADLRLQ